MRRAHPSRLVLSLALVALLPWCLCRLGIAACGFAPPPGAAAVETAACCGGCCGDPSEEEAPSHHGDDCASPCCAPKAAPAIKAPTIPADTVGSLPPWGATQHAALAIAREPSPRRGALDGDTGPPRVGRAFLNAACILLI